MTGIQQLDDLVAYQKLTAVWVYLMVTMAPEGALDIISNFERQALLGLPLEVIRSTHEDARNRYIGKGLK